VGERGLHGKAGCEQDADPRVEGLDPLRQLATRHARHHHVGHEQVDRALGALGKLERLGAAGGGEHRVAVGLEHCQDERADVLGVVDEQDRLVDVERGRLGACLRRLDNPLRTREVELERAAVVRLALERDRSVALPDQAEDGRQAEPAAVLLRREERLEHPALRLGIHADPGVGHLQEHVRARQHAAG
jgi:hypothetical protein